MRKLVIATTAMVVVTLTTFQPATADFGSLLDKIPPFKASDQEASAAPDLELPQPPALEKGSPASTNEVTGQQAFSDTDVDSLDQPLNDFSGEIRSRSPIPPPHVPDDSVGLRSEDSMIESDAEHAVEVLGASSPPPSVEFEELFVEPLAPAPDQISLLADDLQASARSCHPCNSHRHGRGPHIASCGDAAPARQISVGPGLPPPASLESISRTPDCYRGLWDGYTQEKQQRCQKSHAHLHGYCDCHQVKEACCPRDHRSGNGHAQQPRGTCAKTVAPRASVAPGVKR